MTAVDPWLAPGLAFCAAAAFAFGWLWRRLALRRGWMDLPDARRLHVVPTPRGGGIGIALVLLAAFAAGGAGSLLALGLALTAGGGLLDDLRPLRAIPKLATQALGALPLAWALPLFPELLGPVAGGVLAWGLAMALVNAWNFMDGSNGLVATQGALAGTAFALLALVAGAGAAAAAGEGASRTVMVGGVLAAACVGFLPLNAPSARVFLGDVGSHAIGYAVAVLMLDALRRGGTPAVLAWLPVSAVVVDTGLTLAGRMLRGEKFWLGHREHLYQRAIAAGRSHMAVAGLYAAWTVAASGLALALAEATPVAAATATAAVYAAGILLYLRAGRRRHRADRTTEAEG